MTKINKNKIIQKMLESPAFRREMARGSFFHFFYCYFSEYIKTTVAPFHKDMFAVLQKHHSLTIIAGFRHSAKSTIATISLPIWSMLTGRKKYVLIVGQTRPRADKNLLDIKYQLERNRLLVNDLGPIKEEPTPWGMSGLTLNTINARIESISVDQPVRGVLFRGNRPDLIILDDVEDTQSTKTRDNRRKLYEWFTGELLPARGDNAQVVLVGNVVHNDSLVSRLIQQIDKEERTGVYRKYPLVGEDGEPLWKARYPTKESIEQLRKEMGDEVAFEREYMLNIISTAEQVVHKDWIQFHDGLPKSGLRNISIGIDLAISEKDSADCTAIVVGYVYGYGKHMKIYIQPHPVNERITFPVQIETITSLVAVLKLKCNRVKLYIENVGYQEALIQLLKSRKYDVESVPARSDKETRLRLTTPLLKEGQIFFPHEGCEELIEQMLGFGKEKHDDLADAFAILIIKIIENNPKGGSVGLYGGTRFDAI